MVLDTFGWILFKQKKGEKALDILKRASSLVPNSPIILYHFGAIYYAMGNKSAAKESFEKALSISNHFEGAEEARKILDSLH